MSAFKNRRALLRFVFPTICGSLGTWQIYRWQKKREIIRGIENCLKEDPKKIDSIQNAGGDEFQRYQLEGLKSCDERILVGPRGLGPPLGYGYALFEKAKLKNGDLVILNRGHLGMNATDQIPKLEEIITVVEDKEERVPLFGLTKTDKILYKNWAEIRKAFGIPPKDKIAFFKVINDYKSSYSALKSYTLSVEQIPNRHLEYIATWYSLAAFSFLMSFIRK